MKNFLIDHDYILLDELNKNNSYTFKSASIKNTYHLSNLDHFILCQSTFPLTMTKTEFRIFEDVANMSDHNAINLKFLVIKSTPKYESKIPQRKFLKLDNPIIGEFFSKEVNSLLYSTFNNIIDANFPIIAVSQETINSNYSKISSVFKIATEKTHEFQNLVNAADEFKSKPNTESWEIK